MGHNNNNLLLNAKMILNAMISGTDVERVRNYWPDYKINFEAGNRFSIEVTEPAEEPARFQPPPTDFEIAQLAAAAARQPAAPENGDAAALIPVV